MSRKRTHIIETFVLGCSIVALVAMFPGCSRKPDQTALRKLEPGAQFAGFLSDYKQLKPNPNFENTLSYVKKDDVKNIHKYIAVIVDPVTIYVATNADPSKIPDRGRTALVDYFQNAILRSIGDAFPVIQESGPLVLRLRIALIGVDVAPAASTELDASSEALSQALDIGKVGVEMEMVDSTTGEQIAAAVDRQTLGSGAVIGSANFSHEEKFAAAREALDGWAVRLRDFLDSAEELSPEDQRRSDASYQPFGGPPTVK